MKLKSIKRLNLILKIVTAFFVGLAIFATSKIGIPYSDEALRETTIWTGVQIGALLAVVILIVVLRYLKPKAKKTFQESEVLEESTKYVFEEGEENEQEK